MKYLFKSITCILFLATLVSCKKEIVMPADPYVRFGEGIVADSLSFDWKGTVYDGNKLIKMDEAFGVTGLCPRIDLYSNLPKWNIAPSDPEDAVWMFFWPASGKENGKFFVSVDRNLRAESRLSVVNVMDHTGKTWKTFKIFQTGSEPYLDLDMGGINDFNVSAGQGSFRIKLNTNAEYLIREDAPEWMSFSDFTDNSFSVNFEANPDDERRSADFTIVCRNPEYSGLQVSFSVTQRGAQEDFTKATRISIADLKSTYPDGSLIDSNLYIEGTVTSDRDKYNLDEHYYHYEPSGANFTAVIENIPLWMQDESGQGICVEFLTPDDNVYQLGAHFQLHVLGMTIARNEAGVLRLAGAMPDRVHALSTQAVPEPVTVEDLSEIENYEDMLVTLKNVQIAVPYGTYYNADNRQVGQDYTAYPQMLDATSRQSTQLLFDKNGNTVRLVSASTFLDRHCRVMPTGIGDITGIVTRRKSKGGEEIYLRIRSDEDNRIQDLPTPDCARIHVRFGPYRETLDAEQVRANEGTGTLKTSVFEKISEKSSTTAMYYVYSSKWLKPFENVTENIRTITPKADNQYASINSQQWYNATGTTLEDAPGEALIITTNTLNVGDKPLYIAFSNASYLNGPREFRLEWAEDEKAPLSEWTAICDYTTCSWAANWQTGDFLFRVPDEVKGLDKVVFRHRVTSEFSVSGPSSKITSSGTNRTSYWALIEF